jgi:hypothetical protein
MNALWAVVAEERALLDPLEPLIAARQRTGGVQIADTLADVLPDAGSVLMVGGEPPRSVFAGSGEARRVPLGWVAADADRLRMFARTAAEVVSRQAQELSPGPAVLLGQWDQRALSLADEVEHASGVPLFRWTAERLARRELLEALRCGPGLALYLGHALCGGWVAYGGITAAALTARRMHPLGAVLTIAGDAARCHRTRASFCDELVVRGGCAAALGATGKSRHDTDSVLARSAARALTKARTLGELLLRMPEDALHGYRIAGDPAAPLIGAAHACQVAAQIHAPAPEAIDPAILLEPVHGTSITAPRYLTADRYRIAARAKTL